MGLAEVNILFKKKIKKRPSPNQNFGREHQGHIPMSFETKKTQIDLFILKKHLEEFTQRNFVFHDFRNSDRLPRIAHRVVFIDEWKVPGGATRSNIQLQF